MSCCVPGCPTKKRANKPQYKNHSLHSFPRKEEIKREWLELVRLPLITNTTYLRVCSEHFLEQDFFMAGSRRDLRKGVLPSVFEWNESKKGAISNTQAFDTVLIPEIEDASSSRLIKEKCNCVLLQKENERLKLEILNLREEIDSLKNVKEENLQLSSKYCVANERKTCHLKHRSKCT
ncbi:THAP domain-containing protein 2-like [Zophobas morio]|uniref:THAP domain-containing protein 2-like n=1 Tax=Zophobas morio TaxID=2755281 RepID=UPI003083A115